MRILNDLHIGVKRQAGATPASQAALTEFVHQQFKGLVAGTKDTHLLILGDLFDGFSVEVSDVIRTYEVLADWLNDSPARTLTLVCGNHDWSPKAGKVSSFHMLSHFLCSHFGAKVHVVDGGKGMTFVGDGVWAIPHMPNQDLFDLELATARMGNGGYLLLHANYDNKFTVESDHSLNVSVEQAQGLIERGWKLVFAHEHQQRTALDGNVVIIGNQIPTSVADCLGNDSKQFATIKAGDLQTHESLDIKAVFYQVPWQSVDDTPDDALFVRVIGQATMDQAADALGAVAGLRQRHSAYVVTNGIKVDGMAELDTLAEMSFEDITTFNVMEALLEELSEAEGKVVKELLA